MAGLILFYFPILFYCLIYIICHSRMFCDILDLREKLDCRARASYVRGVGGDVCSHYVVDVFSVSVFTTLSLQVGKFCVRKCHKSRHN